MKCFRCNKEVLKKDNYSIIINIENEKEIKRDYVHKVCWNNFTKQLDGASNSLAKSNYLLNAMGKQMKKMGMLPEEEVVTIK